MDLLPVSRKRCLWSLTITMSVSDVKRFHQISRIRRNLLQHRRNIDQNPTILVYLDDLYRRWMGIVSILRHDQAIWRQWDNDMQLWILRHLKGISSTALRCAINFHSVPHRSETLECYNYGAPGCLQLSVSFFYFGHKRYDYEASILWVFNMESEWKDWGTNIAVRLIFVNAVFHCNIRINCFCRLNGNQEQIMIRMRWKTHWTFKEHFKDLGTKI